MTDPPRADRLARQLRRRRQVLGIVVVGLLTTGLALLFARDPTAVGTGTDATVAARPLDTTATDATDPATVSGQPTSTTTVALRDDLVVDPASFRRPWGTEVDGLLTFRGNPTRSYHGTGPVPEMPSVRWTFPDAAMCGPSSEGGETRTWCGNGWTGQPAVFERDGHTWVVFGAYDHQVHFVDAATGVRILPDFPTEDIIKGSVTVDPDGYPLVYIGSRDNYLRVLAIDRPVATELWRLSATEIGPTLWNNDWDGSPLVLHDHLIEGGENSRFHIARLHRGYGADGLVTVAPELVFHAAGWDEELLADVGDNNVSIEQSVAVAGDTAWFANSGGLLQGWDVSSLRTGAGSPTRTFRYWLGDDADASIVADAEGFLYVGVEHERGTTRSDEVGQLLKIDPRRPDAPVVWAVHDAGSDKSGTWSTPAVLDDLVVWPTRPGTVFGIDRASGAVRWEIELPAPLMGSPVVVDDVWIQGDCNGFLHGYDVSDTAVAPPELWAVELGGCVEATPAVWKGRIYVGTRAGRMFALG
ncbi:MAG: outer membrane protein assembly factor BamB family protein [Actinomycetota bacterium]